MWVANEDRDQVHILNGGWLVVDQNVRATTEGLQFAAQQQPVAGVKEKSSSTVTSTSMKGDSVQFAADDRIAHRLECLAMGEEPISSNKSNDKSLLEKDVRATLSAMNLPATQQGAREALLRTGRWTNAARGAKVSPWSKDVLDAADWFGSASQQQKQALYNAARKDGDVQGRIDLTKLPCVCVDAANTAFRDDAIGVRPRASTGRKVNLEASKWEILLHIADVSDVYADKSDLHSIDHDGNLKMLRNAACTRGTSRYDLPNGPLHMMPLPVLNDLSLKAFKPDWTSALSVAEQQKQQQQTVDPCVTMWVYIDERTGKVLDAGLERTIISRPIALTFQTATQLLEGKYTVTTNDHGTADPMAKKLSAMLGVVDRNVQKWKSYRQSTSKRAEAREERMSAYEGMSRQVHGGGNNRRDDGKDGFKRTRGHRLVDASMDLHGYGLATLVRKAGASLPSIIGAKDARIGTGPLRRYIDGMAQRQALSVLCDYEGRPWSKQECFEISKQATDTLNRISNTNASRAKAKYGFASTKIISKEKQQQAVRLLSLQIKKKKKGGISMPATSTGKGSEVLLTDVGED
ncbi:MAG: hypothetical protein SGARI_000777 [Bacillariaceae sp.]